MQVLIGFEVGDGDTQGFDIKMKRNGMSLETYIDMDSVMEFAGQIGQ